MYFIVSIPDFGFCYTFNFVSVVLQILSLCKRHVINFLHFEILPSLSR